MAEASTRGGRTQVSRIIKAPRNKVYQAFLDPEAVAAWLAPDTMQAHVHTFDPRGRVIAVNGERLMIT